MQVLRQEEKNLAIFISGPYRNLRFMLQRLSHEVEEIDYNFDVFVHIWSEDLGVKKRVEVDRLDSERIRNDFPFIKVLIIEKPFLDEDFTYFNLERFEDGQSNPAAIMGMFIGLSRLINCIENSPVKYSHVLRLRTDMIIFDDYFYRNLEIYLATNKIHTSQNYLIPYKWVSDHVILAPTKYFIKMWPKINTNFYKSYKENGLNPEKFLAFQLKKLKAKAIPTFIRYLDYQIVYSKRNKNDPYWVTKINNENIEEIFLQPQRYLEEMDRLEIEEIIYKQKKNQDYYALPKLKKLYIKIFND